LSGRRQVRRRVGAFDLSRSVHRLAGLFVAAGFAHGLLDGTPFAHAQVLRWSFVAIGGTGGKWHTVISSPVSTASAASSAFHARGRDPLEPPPSPVISSRPAARE